MISVVRTGILSFLALALLIPSSAFATTPVLDTKLRLTAPNGGEVWEVGTMNTITWTPYGYDPDVNPPTDITAYLERAVGSIIRFPAGTILPSGKASIHWETEIDTQGKYAKPGKYYIRIKNNKTGEWDRSDKPFTLEPRSVDLRVNGSNGPVRVRNGTPITLSWTTKGDFIGSCTATGVSASEGSSDRHILDLPVRGSVRAYYTGDNGIGLYCQKTENISRSDYVEVKNAATPNNPVVRVVSPNGGEALTATTQQVLYEANGARSVSIALYKNDQFHSWLAKDHTPIPYEKGGYAFSWTSYNASLETEGSVFKIYITASGNGIAGYGDDKSDGTFRFGAGKDTSVGKLAITSFVASPTVITNTGTTILSWKTVGAQSCSLSVGNQTIQASVDVNGSHTVTADGTTTYRLACKGKSDGREQATTYKDLTVSFGGREPAPSCSVTADKTPVTSGERVELTWKSKYTDYVVLSGGDKGAANGSMIVNPSVTTTYSFTAYGVGGKSGCSTTVEVSGNTSPSTGTLKTPTISSFTSSTLTQAKQAVVLKWVVADALRCVLSGDDGMQQQVETTGYTTVHPLQTTTYTLWCANDPGTGKDGPSASKSLTVNLVQYRFRDIGAAVGSMFMNVAEGVGNLFGW